MKDVRDTKKAETEAEAAKARLLQTAQLVKSRFSPAVLKQDAVNALSDRATQMGRSIRETAAKHPAVATAAAAGISFVFLYKPIRWILRSISKEK
jgi:hypothetical protein